MVFLLLEARAPATVLRNSKYHKSAGESAGRKSAGKSAG